MLDRAPRPILRCAARPLAAVSALVVVLATSAARADEGDEIAQLEQSFLREHGDRPIAAVRVEGLHRTRPAVVEQWLTCRVGAALSSCDLASVRERVYRLGIFRRADFALVDGPKGVEIVLTLEEKWTLYPVPMLWYTPGTELAGLVLADANLLGYNKGVAIGGMVSNRGWYTIAGYSDPNIAFTDGWATLHLFYGSGIVEDDARDGSIEQSFEMSRFDLEYALGWTFGDRWSPAWTGAVRSAKVGTVRVPGDEPATDATVAIQGLSLTYSDRRFRDLFDEGLRLSAEVQHAFPMSRDTSSYDVGIFEAKYARAMVLRGFWELRARAFVSALPAPFEERLGGLDGSRTIPGSGLVGADQYAFVSAEAQVPIVSVSPGTMSAGVFGEVGRYSRNAEPTVTYGGPGVGVRFFLRDVAIPAFGADLGYEVGSRRLSVSVVIGYRPVR